METNNKAIFDFVKPSDNDSFSKMNNSELKELFNLINSYYLEYRKKLDFDSAVTFGMEIEFEYAMLKRIKEELVKLQFNGLWDLEMDVTVAATDGAEVVSPILKDNLVVWADLKKVCDILKKYAIIGENSGGHIHAGAHILGDKEQSWHSRCSINTRSISRA